MSALMLPMKFLLCCSKIGFLAVRDEIVTRNKKLSNKTWNLKVVVQSLPTNTQVQMPELNCLEIIFKRGGLGRKPRKISRKSEYNMKGGKVLTSRGPIQ